jgi:hypothetical protein
MAGNVSRDDARLRSRVEIDARARAARVALERSAKLHGGEPAVAPGGALDGTPVRLRVLAYALGTLWRRLAGPAEPVLAPMREGQPATRRDPFA